MHYRFIAPLLISVLGCSAALAAAPDWVARSNRLAEPVLDVNAQFGPEDASQAGKEMYDTNIVDLKPRLYEREVAATEKVIAQLRSELKTETDPNVKQDLEIMIDTMERNVATAQLNHRLMLDYVDIPQTVFDGLHVLLDPRNKPERQARALTRLQRYAGLEKGYKPLTELARAYESDELKRQGLIGPYVEEIKQDLDNTDADIKGLSDLFTEAKLTGWQEPLATLAKQLHEHDAWVRANILPRTRPNASKPPALYADALKQFGVNIGPDELIERASADFLEVQGQMQMLAAQMAHERNLPSADYRDIIRDLKKTTQVSVEGMVPLYKERLADIETIVRREHLITLPNRTPIIRLGTDAESSQLPAPHINTPRLIGNTGEMAEFVIPTSNPHAKTTAKYDDFDTAGVSWTLAAHELRPGHELQFASILERGVSVPRALFAFNSANVEGWALYCEAMMLPYMPEDGQLFSLQGRLQRMARAFLDPMVNLGKISPDDAKKFLMDNVVLSEPMAQQEADRYAFKMPGQATSYYYGYIQMRGLRAQAEIALGQKFNLMAFNDFIIGEGVLPPTLLKRAIAEDFVPSQLNAAKVTASK
jgi:hypothetical protein